ncbi:response regulator [Sulfurimonas sp. HSL-1716]|uniref:hybrid sensor histidine kinase/response regulator n=1 Tax=Hydrocurvibacter sulfurireducens TaxID=3131937 RepID=UPI0031F84EC1
MGINTLTALLVEDNDSIREQTLKILKRTPFKEIYTAKDGEEGLNLYYKYQPDIVLSDHYIPKMNGLDMSEKIKEDNQDIPIILITAAEQVNILERAINIGIDGYIFKPVRVKKLLHLIDKLSKRALLHKHLKNQHKLLEEYKGAIDASASVTKTDPTGVITYVNDSFCYMSGYEKEELIGKRHNIVKHPDTSVEIYKNMWGTITNKQVWKGRIKNLKKNHEVYYEYAVIVPILDEDDEIVEYIALTQDITDLYLHEQYLKERINEEINKNTKLLKEREEEHIREEKFSTIGKMAAGITHEINTPLTYIKGNLEIMFQDIASLSDDIKQKAYLQDDIKTILNGVNRIASIVESMREMASKSTELPKPTNVYSCLMTALTLSSNKAKQISKIYVQDELFTLDLNKNRYTFNAVLQKQRIEQLFIIIINNALDALNVIEDFDSRALMITLYEQDEYIVVKFKDTGGGISEEILPKIFDPFQSNKEEGGIGIGLNVAKRIIDDHGGKIIPSNWENGAIFEVYLPKIRKEIEEY